MVQCRSRANDAVKSERDYGSLHLEPKLRQTLLASTSFLQKRNMCKHIPNLIPRNLSQKRLSTDESFKLEHSVRVCRPRKYLHMCSTGRMPVIYSSRVTISHEASTMGRLDPHRSRAFSQDTPEQRKTLGAHILLYPVRLFIRMYVNVPVTATHSFHVPCQPLLRHFPLADTLERPQPQLCPSSLPGPPRSRPRLVPIDPEGGNRIKNRSAADGAATAFTMSPWCSSTRAHSKRSCRRGR